MTKFKNYALPAVFLILMLTRCANMAPLTGGDKDVLPPKVLQSDPQNMSTDFKGNRITINFDEYILLKDIYTQLIVTPKLKEQPEITVRGKSLEVKFKEPLKPNTTYNVNFGNSIVDLHESNSMQAYRFVFSTGSAIDSLKLNGQLINAFTLEPVTAAKVMLYETINDSVVYNEKPDYYNNVNASGEYEIPYIRNGKYKLMAIKDENNNFLYDAGELMGFIDEPIVSITENTTHNILLSKEKFQKIFIKKTTQPSYGKIQICYNTATDTINDLWIKSAISKSIDKKDIAWTVSKTKDTVNLYYKNIYADTLLVYTRFNNSLRDSFKIDVPSQQLLEQQKKKKNLRMEVSTSFANNKTYPYYKIPALQFNRMMKTIRPEMISVINEKDTLKLSSKNIQWQSATEMNLMIDLKPDQEYKLNILPEAFTDVLDISNDTLKYSFKTQRNDYYASLNLNIQLPLKQNYIVQLYNSKGNFVTYKTIYVSNVNDMYKLVFDKLDPDTYALKLIEDKDADGKYTPGNYSKKTQPEKVLKYTQAVKVPENWAVEVEWKVKEIK